MINRLFFIAAVIPAIFIVLASYAGCDRMLVVAWFTLAMGFMGTFYPGMKVNPLDLSKYPKIVLKFPEIVLKISKNNKFGKMNCLGSAF